MSNDKTKKFQVIKPSADVRIDPDKPELSSELLMGEIFIAEEDAGIYLKGYCEHDNEPGYIAKTDVSDNIYGISHYICVPHTIAYEHNFIESYPKNYLSFGCRIRIIEEGEGLAGEEMYQIQTGEWVMRTHLKSIDTIEPDYVATALKFLNTPYRWGARSGLGIDCSGLTQIALAAAGIKIPRNADPQSMSDNVGAKVEEAEIKRGDLVFFKGHVGIMINETEIITAIGDSKGRIGGKTSMITRIDSLETMKELYKGITCIRRPYKVSEETE